MTLRFLVVILFFTLARFPLATAQILPPTPPGQSTAEDPAQAEWKRKMVKAANKKRQDELRKDTEQLLKLSTELKDYVDKTNQDILSLDVLKKAEEIEKLAHSVKEKMKVSY